MERKNLILLTATFLISAAVGFGAGQLTAEPTGPQRFDQRLDFEANSSNPVTDVSFDGRNMSIIVQPGKNASFFLEFNGSVEPVKGLIHDGEIHEFREMKAIDGKTYLLYFRYNDDPQEQGDEWLKLYRAREL